MSNFCSDKYSGHFLRPGEVDKKLFHLLIDISSVRSEHVIRALEAFFVMGHERRLICDEGNISPGYLSVKIRELRALSQKISAIHLHYQQLLTDKV
ncbi:TPA: hypothetical protein J4Z76_001319 [Escherichia coli]|nr:hypothetical protein [Escherichia coli]HCQ0091583.1 hypothetical protein [Escherichia coli]